MEEEWNQLFLVEVKRDHTQKATEHWDERCRGEMLAQIRAEIERVTQA
jgi:hypothetical protein